LWFHSRFLLFVADSRYAVLDRIVSDGLRTCQVPAEYFQRCTSFFLF
jgi:hypothetical protein